MVKSTRSYFLHFISSGEYCIKIFLKYLKASKKIFKSDIIVFLLLKWLSLSLCYYPCFIILKEASFFCRLMFLKFKILFEYLKAQYFSHKMILQIGYYYFLFTKMVVFTNLWFSQISK